MAGRDSGIDQTLEMNNLVGGGSWKRGGKHKTYQETGGIRGEKKFPVKPDENNRAPDQ